MQRIGTVYMTCGMICLLLARNVGPVSAAVTSPEQVLREAIDAYRAALDSSDRGVRVEQFRRAELLFAQLTHPSDAPNRTGGIRNADLYVNLGNAALGAEQLGPAILAYRRALRLDPDHQRARQNLAHARTLLPDWVPRAEEGSLLDTFFAWTGRLSLGQVRTFAGMVFLVTAILIASAVRWRQPVLRHLALIPGMIWLLLLSWMVFWSFGNAPDMAVVTLPEVVARSADSAGAPPRLPQPLPGGTEVQVLETRAEWLHVRLLDGRDAWLPQSALELVNGQTLTRQESSGSVKMPSK